MSQFGSRGEAHREGTVWCGLGDPGNREGAELNGPRLVGKVVAGKATKIAWADRSVATGIAVLGTISKHCSVIDRGKKGTFAS